MLPSLSRVIRTVKAIDDRIDATERRMLLAWRTADVIRRRIRSMHRQVFGGNDGVELYEG